MEEILQATEFDQQTSSHNLQMVKAALPYVAPHQQKMLSVFVKLQELSNTMRLFSNQDQTLGICSVSEEKRTPFEMLEAVKSYCTDSEKEMLETFSNFLQASQLYGQYQTLFHEANVAAADEIIQ